MSSRPDFANPGTWHSDTVTEIGDIYMVSEDDAQSNPVYRNSVGNYYAAQFAEAIGLKYLPLDGGSDGNWTFQQLGCTDIKIDINGGAAGEVYANGRNQAKVTVHYCLTEPGGTPLPNAVQKRAKVTLVHTVSGDDPGGDGWRVSDTPGAFVSAPARSRESGATTGSGDHTATQVLYLSHDGSDASSGASLAARVTYGSNVFDDVNGDHSGDLITVTSLPRVRYQLGSGNCEQALFGPETAGSHEGYVSEYSKAWLMPVDKNKPFMEVEVRTSPGTPPASGSESNFSHCCSYECTSYPPGTVISIDGYSTPASTLVSASFYWPLSAGGSLDAQDLGLGPYVRVTPVQGAVNVAFIQQVGPWDSTSWPDKNYAPTAVCRASDAWGNCGYFSLQLNYLTDATEADFNNLPG